MVALLGVAAIASSLYPVLLDLLTTYLMEGDAGVERVARETTARLALPELPPLDGARVLGGLVGIVFLKAVAAAVAALETARIRRQISAELRQRVYAGLVEQSVDAPAWRGRGRQLDHALGDVAEVEQGVDLLLGRVLADGLKAIAVAVVVSVAYPRLLFVAIFMAPVVVPLVLWLARRASRSAAAVHAARGGLSQHVSESLAGLRTIRVFGGEARARAKFGRLVQQHARARRELDVLQALQRPVMELIGVGLLVAAVILGSWVHGTVRPGAVVGFVLGLVLLYEPLKAVGRSLAGLASAAEAKERIRDLQQPAAEVAPPLPADVPFRELELLDVHFRHARSSCDVLRGISVRLGRGRPVALVGASGAGKSTLVAVLCRLFEPTAGQLTIDGVRVGDHSAADWRRHVALLDQEPFIFDATVADNIRYGAPHASAPEVQRAARQARLHETIRALPKGYETRLGEGGYRLSGGERQRLALARAFLRNAPILIVDEPTSALDAATEASLLDAFEALWADRITLIITHRAALMERTVERMALIDGQLKLLKPKGIPPSMAPAALVDSLKSAC